MSYETIRLTIEADVATITLDRQARLNAMTPTMADEISDALDQLGSARAVLFTGAGRAFCAGADLVVRDAQSVPPGEGGFQVLAEHYNPLLTKLAGLGCPIVSAVNGPAAGIGCALALAADFVLVARSSFLLFPFVNIGLAGDGGAAWTLIRLIGRPRAAQMLMLGERVPAETAESWGLVYRCTDDAALLDEAKILAARLAAGPTRALGLIRRALFDGFDLTYDAALRREAEVRLSLGDSPDTHEGGRAFLEKRKPSFIGR